jgi:hypothetical protein
MPLPLADEDRNLVIRLAELEGMSRSMLKSRYIEAGLDRSIYNLTKDKMKQALSTRYLNE